ncbi:MAG: hypothetical protein HOQ17_11455 [Gemmatimonadaceae bacterium]|nr:hypothetical protein [Gemmatimonadaceae bacterium]NUO95455.1 hypothetical protein [Gemmatimonadaceae bacterium]NUP54685.1 hypothetical protein [Gemmatimonadaceae bacterium]NUP70437.1 hypothetical protein [Gemmatimonadaceae bacterium]NUR34779.1 hypothetical protein [Gemmatimonadaceae bacterium]
MDFMWADTLLAAERAHVLRLLLWGGGSTLVGTALLAWLHIGRRRSALLEQFGLQTAAWGAAELVFAAISRASLVPRDLAAATRLDRLLWLELGLDAGYLLVGLTLVASGWALGRRLGMVGAGLAVAVQGVALALLHLLLAGQISR